MYFYLEANKDNIYHLNLNKSKNEIYNRLIETGISWHLQQYKEKKYTNYEKNLEWFRTTDYYKNNEVELKKKLSTENPDEKFKFIKKRFYHLIYKIMEKI